MARRHHHRKARRPPDPFPLDEDSVFQDFNDNWGDHGMFMVGFTPDAAASLWDWSVPHLAGPDDDDEDEEEDDDEVEDE